MTMAAAYQPPPEKSSSSSPQPIANAATTSVATTATASTQKPLTIGVFGGSFNPIHLGHTLLAVTTQQTKDYIDQVVLVPVYKHAVKRNLLPFEDRVQMCRLAVQHHFTNITVSTIERQVGASNGAMLQGLQTQYPSGTKFIWICGDDFFAWMHTPKGMETLQCVHGLIVQRRLHRQDGDRFYKDPINEQKVQQIALQMNLSIDYIYGELPHFSSTLVRRAPGHWRSFLTNAVIQYLDERPHLQQQLLDNLHADVDDDVVVSDTAKTQTQPHQDITQQQSPSLSASSASLQLPVPKKQKQIPPPPTSLVEQ
jgi:nicotinate (nicotinamide) nucleotide adenylyltransferase